mgnify:CR=1 FL=1
MPTALPILQPVPVLKNKDYHEVMIREMEGGKIPISLGKTCPVKCEFCSTEYVYDDRDLDRIYASAA